jgi:hypothetical protein
MLPQKNWTQQCVLFSTKRKIRDAISLFHQQETLNVQSELIDNEYSYTMNLNIQLCEVFYVLELDNSKIY